MSGKHYSQYLLRALEGEDLRLDEELSGLVELGERLRGVMPGVPAPDRVARRRMWESAVAGAGETAALPRLRIRVPRPAWAAAAALALALVAVLALVLIYGDGPAVHEPREIASLYVESGEMAVRDAQGEERAARDGMAVNDGEVVLAAAGARGFLEFETGPMLRMHGEAAVGVAMPEGGVEAEVFKGRTYHRVVGGTPYTAHCGDVRVEARGTAFTFDVEGRSGKVISVQSAVDVAVERTHADDWAYVLEEGKVFIFGVEEEPLVEEVTFEELDDEWVRWNRDLDEMLGFPLGVLVLLEEVEADEPQAEPEHPSDPSAGEEAPEPAPQPAPEPPPQPPPEPAPQPAPEQGGVALSASARSGAVDLSWNVSGYSGFQGFKLCRSESIASPSYPGDWWMYIDGAGTRSAVDASVKPGRTYYYRLAVYDRGDVLAYSNAVQVTVPGAPQEPSITLSAVVEGGKVKLSWSVSGEGAYSGFKVCRSETDPNPTYPGGWNVLVGASARSYADAAVTSGSSYYYRVGIYKDGAVLKYSNSVKATIP